MLLSQHHLVADANISRVRHVALSEPTLLVILLRGRQINLGHNADDLATADDRRAFVDAASTSRGRLTTINKGLRLWQLFAIRFWQNGCIS